MPFGTQGGGGVKSRRRKAIKFFLLFSFFAAALAVYLHYGLFPGKLKIYTIRKIEELTQKKVVFEKALYVPTRGLTFTNLTVKNEDGSLLFFTRRLTLAADPAAFFKDKKIIVRRVVLESPVYDCALEPTPDPAGNRGTAPMTKLSGQIPVPLIPERKPPGMDTLEEGPNAFLPENVYLESVEITNGFVTLRKYQNSAPIEVLSAINVRMGFLDPPYLVFDGSLKIGQERTAAIWLHGTWNLNTAVYEFDLEAAGSRIPEWLLQYQKPNFLMVTKGRVALRAKLKSLTERKAFFTADARLSGCRISLEETVYSGLLSMDVRGLFDFESKLFERYRGLVNLEKMDISNLMKEIPRLDAVEGKIYFEPDWLEIRAVHGRFKNIDFQIDGDVRSFKELRLDAALRTRADLGQVLALIPPDQKVWLKDFQLRGQCESVTTVQGSLKNPSGLRQRHKLLIHDGAFLSADGKVNITGIFSEIRVSEALVQIAPCRFVHAGTTYSLKATLPRTPGRSGNVSLSSPELSLFTVFKHKNQAIQLDRARLSAHGLRAGFEGILSNFPSPRVDVHGNFEADLERAFAWARSRAPGLKNTELSGLMKGAFALQGPWNNPLAANVKVDAETPALLVQKKLKLEDLRIQARMVSGIMNIPYFHGRAYRGALGGRMILDLSKPGIPFSGTFHANNLDLALLGKELNANEGDLSGTALFQTTLAGALKSQETYRGAGSMDIRDGTLWKTGLFKPMGRLPFVKVMGLEEVVFKNMSVVFQIHDKKIWSENLHLSSDTVDLSLKGSVGFDQSIDMLMDIQYSNDVLRGAAETGGIVPFVIEQAEQMISQYRVSGTLKNPKYEKLLLKF